MVNRFFNARSAMAAEYFDDGAEAVERLNLARGRGEKFALSLSPLMAWLVVHGHCDVINNSLLTAFRGELYIHATRVQLRGQFAQIYAFASSVSQDLAAKIPYFADLNRDWSGGIVGRVDVVDVFAPESDKFTSFWHERGMAGWRVANPMAFDMRVPCRGRPGFWAVDEPAKGVLVLKDSALRKGVADAGRGAGEGVCGDSCGVVKPRVVRKTKSALRSDFAKLSKKCKRKNYER